MTCGSRVECNFRLSGQFGCRHLCRFCRRKSGAPRSMKMGTIPSPWRYDAAARHSLQSASLRRPAILHYA